MPCTGALGSGSSVFWSRPSSSPPRRTPSLRQEQQTEGERETGGVKRRKGWEMQGGRGRVGGGRGWGAKGESGGEGREGGRGRAGGRESWGTVGGRGGRGRGGGCGARAWDSASSPRETPAGIPKTLRHGHVALGFKVPALGGCPEVRASEPAGGTYPHSRFLDHVHVYTRARYASKGQSPPCLSLTPPPSMG